MDRKAAGKKKGGGRHTSLAGVGFLFVWFFISASPRDFEQYTLEPKKPAQKQPCFKHGKTGEVPCRSPLAKMMRCVRVARGMRT